MAKQNEQEEIYSNMTKQEFYKYVNSLRKLLTSKESGDLARKTLYGEPLKVKDLTKKTLVDFAA